MANSREHLRAIAECKLDDALLLFENQRYSNAYYLVGYAIECALKACIARQVLAETIPDKGFINAVYTHRFDALIGLAGLRAELKTRQDESPQFQAYWALASEWTPEVRYESVDKATANLMLVAVADNDCGVLPWIRNFW